MEGVCGGRTPEGAAVPAHTPGSSSRASTWELLEQLEISKQNILFADYWNILGYPDEYG